MEMVREMILSVAMYLLILLYFVSMIYFLIVRAFGRLVFNKINIKSLNLTSLIYRNKLYCSLLLGIFFVDALVIRLMN